MTERLTLHGGFLHMNIAETRLTLDGYRIQVLEKLKSCPDAAGARDILADADLVLSASGLSERAQQAFWHALGTDLTVLAEESGMPASDAEARLTAIIKAAATDIAERLGVLSSGTPRSR